MTPSLYADKTGTLTQNKLTLGETFCVGNVSVEDRIFYASLASTVSKQDSIDLAVLEESKKQNKEKDMNNY